MYTNEILFGNTAIESIIGRYAGMSRKSINLIIAESATDKSVNNTTESATRGLFTKLRSALKAYVAPAANISVIIIKLSKNLFQNLFVFITIEQGPKCKFCFDSVVINVCR